MKEELYLNSLTHIEKLDMFCKAMHRSTFYHQNLEKQKDELQLQNSISVSEGILEKNGADFDYHKAALVTEFSALENDVEAYLKSCGEVGVWEYDLLLKNPYIKKIKDLYMEVFPETDLDFNTYIAQTSNAADEYLKRLHSKMIMLGNFITDNKRIFKISKNLIDRLNYTDCKSDISYVKAPYNHIYIQFPYNFAKMEIERFEKGVEGVYLNTNNNTLSMIIVPRAKIDFDGGSFGNIASLSCMPITQIDLSKKITIKKIVNNFKESMDDFNDVDGYVITTIIKVLMYMSSVNNDMGIVTPVENTKTSKKKKLKKKKTTLPYEYVGGNIVINNNNNFTNGSGNGTGRQITTKFMVRGHYHGFWMNLNDDIPSHQIVDIKDDKMLVRKWVEPFWKGSEFAEVVLKDYKVN
jgi:hypothetical protein